MTTAAPDAPEDSTERASTFSRPSASAINGPKFDWEEVNSAKVFETITTSGLTEAFSRIDLEDSKASSAIDFPQ